MRKVRAIILKQFGDPGVVAQPGEIELPSIEPHEALVRMIAAPINPADLNVIEGKYPIRPELPGVPGGEGIGVVEEVGSAVSDLEVGTLVLVSGTGTWREACVVLAEDLVAVPAGVAPEQAAMLRVNPATALCLLREFVNLQPGDWIVQNAANSGVGRAVIQIAHHFGWRTLNIVRRAEALADLAGEPGATHCFVEDEHLPAAIDGAVRGAPIRLALNAVGGESALALANLLAQGGTIVTYGAMARRPLRIPNGLLIFKDLAWRGFWVTRWYEQASRAAQAALFAELIALLQAGVLHSPIERIYPLEAASEALAHASRGARRGKILFGFDPALFKV
ncbi:MAG: Alcohol dehydrogenase zinc-binding domain protein [Chthoniobacter sp.]|nr:Alcohol dehydrogenase zinc-binding domain protein [Chthoniobacter sp.]